MTDKKKIEIEFKPSMGFDERDYKFAQLRKNMLDKIGMFPSAEWENEYLSDNFKPDMLVSGNGLWAIGSDDTNDVSFYKTTTGSSLSEDYRGGHTTDSWVDAKFYYNGTDEMIYGIDNSGDVNSWDTNTETYTHDVYTGFAAGGEKLMGYNTSTDNLYYISGYNLYKQDQTTFSASLKTLSQNYTYKQMIDFEDWIVIIGENKSNDEVKAFFYDVINEPNGFSNVKTIGRGKYMVGGVIDGFLTIVLSVEEHYNTKELKGSIVVKSFSGVKFKPLNKIVALNSQVYIGDQKGYSDGTFLYIGINKDDVKSGGVYRISSNGQIVNLGENTFEITKKYKAINNYYGTLIIAGEHDDSSNSGFIAQKYDGTSSDSDLNAWSEYVTNFIGDSTVNKKMIEFTIGFTKTEVDFNDEEFEVYYRTIDPYDIDDETDENNSWTLFMTYDYDEDGQSNRKIQRHTSGQTLPEFKEIQFKFKTRNGMNITKAKMKYEYLKDE